MRALVGRVSQCSSPVYNVDGTLNEAGSITEVVDLVKAVSQLEQSTFQPL